MERLTGERNLTVETGSGLETIAVRALKLSQFPALLAALGDEAAQLALYTGRNPEWIDALPLTAAEAILEAGEELNRDFFLRWLERRKTRQSLIAGDLDAKLAGIVEQAAREILARAMPTP